MEFGCHGITWVLDYDKEIDFLDDILDTVSQNGFKTVDIIYATLGKYKNDPEALKKSLDKRNLKLGAFTVPFSWENDEETKEEQQLADFCINYLSKFPDTILNLPVRPGKNRDNLLKRQKQIINCANTVGKRASHKGVKASFHPATPGNSYFKNKSDYQVLFDNLNTKYIGYTPDTGHIEAAGMNSLKIIKDNYDIIRHVHLKDCSRSLEWTEMGTGIVDFPQIIKFLNEKGYDGWIMVEEETPESPKKPGKTVENMSVYVHKNLLPIINE
ncbi:xylose isomerase [Tetragenococcus halophilus subsp. flandriensis]|uniref:sugar phosphate isomerase/epimerase family protein n=1 Tax=Tetragenococcus halophilus TaxID=51669 RepID=UPI0023E9262D|nr:TIM barrel protein [Tetragenococcus halophilus]GMA09366.1 xylose isomerase [Tetragenococcus halophilus subsp. flandriensis]